jgi:signal transduction histidine kinase
MRLAKFIDQAREQILAESVKFASTLPVLGGEAGGSLRNHLPLVLDTIVRDLEQPQSRAESIAKSEGRAPASLTETAAQSHGLARARSGLTIEQLIAEYRVLRSCVLRLWADAHPPDQEAIEDTMRFNEAIDQAVSESVAFYHAEVERWRSLFLGVLGHDLRGPLNAMLMAAEVMARKAKETAVAEPANALVRNGHRLQTLLDSLLEYNKSALGVGIMIHRSKVDLAALCKDEVDVLRAALPATQIVFKAEGDTSGYFDGSRVREAVANLVFNAAQHGQSVAPVTLMVAVHDGGVQVSTENETEPIPHEVLQNLFEPLRRYATDAPRDSRGNLGLGLFIVREIARAHGGDATVSMEGRRIRFRMDLPKTGPIPQP